VFGGLNDDFSGALSEALAGAEIEGHAGPAPVVDLQPECNEGFRVGIRGDVLLLAITGTGWPSTTPSPYWPRTAQVRTSSGSSGWMA